MKKFTVFTLVGLAFAAVLTLTAFKSNTNTTNNNPYILVEIYEIPSYPDRGVHIHYGNNKTEVVPFKSMKSEDHDQGGDIVLATINKLVSEGYHIEHTAAGLSEAGMITKIFMRKK
jgi:hypothetical protein